MERTSPGGSSLPLIVVLSRTIPSPDAFRKETRKLLKDPIWVMNWLNHRAPTTIGAIFEKKVVEGMSQAEMMASLGWPRNAADSADAEVIEWVADYGDQQITLQGNMVTQIVSRRAEAEKIRAAAAEKARILAEKARAEAEKRQQEAEARKAEEALVQAKVDLAAAKAKAARYSLGRDTPASVFQRIRW